MKDYFGYKGKVCVVTGAASGMGKATTEILVDLEAEVYALDVMEVKVPGIKSFVSIDLSSRESIDKAFEQLPEKIDSFFGIAGISGMKSDYNTTVIVNLISNKYITDNYLIDRMNEDGAISYITSSGGLGWQKEDHLKEIKELVEVKGWDESINVLNSLNQQKTPGILGYALSKRSMNYYIATIVSVFGEKKIRVNGVLAAPTKSGLTDDFVAAKGGMDKFLESTGLAKRIAESKEMAEPIVFLNSNMASYISGVLLDVDYGQNIMVVAGLAPDKMNFKLLSR